MMRAVVIGAHGRTGSRIVEHLQRDGHDVTGTIRDRDHAEVLLGLGAQAEIVDLERAGVHDFTPVLANADAVVYAAGSGRGSSADTVLRVDRDAIIAAADAAVREGVARFILISAHRTDNDVGIPHIDHLLRAKRAADAHLRGLEIGWTIIRPDALTEAPAQGRAMIAEKTPQGALSRDDLASAVIAALESDVTIRRQFEITGGDEPIADGLAALGEGPG